MPAKRIAFGGMVPAGFQRIVTNSTAVALNSTVRAAATVLDITVDTQSVRYRADGTAPTATTGILLASGQTYRLDGFNGTSVLKFARVAAGAIINVQGWKYEA